jgi:hypothetical protein
VHCPREVESDDARNEEMRYELDEVGENVRKMWHCVYYAFRTDKTPEI